MKKRTIRLCALLAFLLAVLLLCYALPEALMPPRKSYGATWDSFLKEEKNSADILFFGSSMVYCDVVPAVIWDEIGASAYVMAGPEQIIPQTYYYLREALKTQSPQVACFELTGMFYPEYTNYTKVNIGYMPWGANRVKASFDAAEKAQRTGLLFPLYNYHDRWDMLLCIFSREKAAADPLAGYTFLTDAAPVSSPREYPVDFSADVYSRNADFLQKIYDLCVKKGITPVFFIAPSYSRLADRYLLMLGPSISAMDKAVFFDFNAELEQIGIDKDKDFYDYLHFNRFGAEKFSRYLASRLMSEITISPSDKGRESPLWRDRLRYFNEK